MGSVRQYGLQPERLGEPALTAPLKESEGMGKEFESKLAKRISGKKRASRVWIAMMSCAALVVVGAFSVTAAMADSNGNQTGDMDGEKDQDQVQEQAQDGSCDGGICPNPDCPYSDE